MIIDFPYFCKGCNDTITITYDNLSIPPKNCPYCGSEKIQRIYGAANSIWKCSGSYKPNHKEC